ncbi:Putative auto-transporter adhesin, head GIN domain [Parasphingorhabdus marina DSM 22363]|uniref:Putative auto-transporter adhesin, head GIN domain n=1 Tax=Parasphingorhabdus marina DSM 22363 TaxID=1123272 RepID=A0A1N6CU39_9SPHN|nr:head GIN domain-containing protein [Parasphingorhabdus marina]SIN61989.1 Putative auto-transporter adhesin, head GIN domain [Parasphingorhabdus marina DSM 22363]
MKKLLMVVPILALAACEGSIASAVADGAKSSFPDGIAITTSDSNPGDFSGVTLAGPDNVVFTTGSDFSIRAEGDPDAIEELRYKIKDGQLKIGRESDGIGWSSNSGSAVVYVSAPSLKNAKLAGSGDLKVDEMSDESASLSLAGSGNIDVANVKTASLKAKLAGSGDMVVAGSADSASVSIAGSGDVRAKDLKADSASIKIMGSGDASLSSDGTVDAKIMGSGDIRIHGEATCKSKTMGSGDVTCG